MLKIQIISSAVHHGKLVSCKKRCASFVLLLFCMNLTIPSIQLYTQGLTHLITAKSVNTVHPEQMTNVKPRDIYALAVQPVIASKDMEIHSNMLTFHMMILVIQDFVAWVGRVLLIIVGEFVL